MTFTPQPSTEDSPRVLGALASAATGARLPRMHDATHGPLLVTRPADAVDALRCPHLQQGFNINRTGTPAQPEPLRPHPPLARARTQAAFDVFSADLAVHLDARVAFGTWSAVHVDVTELLALPVARSAVTALHPHASDAAQSQIAAATLAWVDTLGPVIAAARPPGRLSPTRRRERRAHSRLLRLLETHTTESAASSPPEQAAVLAAAVQVPIAAGAWLINLLSHAPEVQDAVAAEADHPRASGGPSPEPRPWAECVAWETLRLYPPTWMLPRTAVADVELAGQLVHAGQDVLVSPFLLGRHPALVPPPPSLTGRPASAADELDIEHPTGQRLDVEDFLPSRWRDPGTRPGRWLPFGAGVHACPGRALSLRQLTELAEQACTSARVHPPTQGTRVSDRRGLLPDPVTVVLTPRRR